MLVGVRLLLFFSGTPDIDEDLYLLHPNRRKKKLIVLTRQG